MNIFVFDIETIPDVMAGRKLHNLSNLSDAEVVSLMYAKQQQKNGSDFLPLYLHKIVAISVVLRSRDALKVWSLGTPEASEKELIQRFYDGIEKYVPIIVSWNGAGFDLPVLHYRSLINQVIASQYWENGASDSNFKWNNYTNRYHERHTDLMDVLAGFQVRANAPLDHIASLLGFPGKMGMDGSKVWDAYQAGRLDSIRNYCETDVLNTYLVYLRFELMRGKLTVAEYNEEIKNLRGYLQHENKLHFSEFLEQWNSHG